MNTRSIFSARTIGVGAPRLAALGGMGKLVCPCSSDRRRGQAITFCAMILALSGGCGYSQGAFLYMFGMGQGKLVPAEFTLTEQPLLILIDDASQRLDSPRTASRLFDDLAQELRANEAATRIVPQRTILHLRQSLPDFEKRGAREIGKLVSAEQVLWIQIRDFRAASEIEDVTSAAYISASVKVLSAAEEKRSRVRLWPISPDGHRVTVTMTGSEAAIQQTNQRIADELAKRLSVEVAKLFYEHRLDDFARE